MKKLSWFEKAKEDLNEIYNFYFIKNPVIAAKIFNSILDEVEILKKFPEIAVREPLYEDRGFEYTYRSLVTKNGLFKIIYFTEGDMVVITRIWCCRKNPEGL